MPFGIAAGGIASALGAGAIGTGIAGAAGGAIGGALSAFGSNKHNAAAAAAYNAPLQAGINQAEAISQQPFSQYTGNLTAPITAQEQQAAGLAGINAQESQQYQKEAATPFSGAAVQQYVNPYRQNVINPTLQNLTTNYQTELANLTRKQNMTDAFGYGRTAAAASPLTQQYQQEYGNVEQSGLANAYTAGENEFNKQQSAFADLAKQAGNAGENGVGGLLATGKDIREAGTEADQAQYKEFLRGQNWSRDQIQPLLQILGTSYKGGLQTPAYTNPLTSIMGGAASGAGMAGSLFGKSGGGASINPTLPTVPSDLQSSDAGNNISADINEGDFQGGGAFQPVAPVVNNTGAFNGPPGPNVVGGYTVGSASSGFSGGNPFG